MDYHDKRELTQKTYRAAHLCGWTRTSHDETVHPHITAKVLLVGTCLDSEGGFLERPSGCGIVSVAASHQLVQSDPRKSEVTHEDNGLRGNASSPKLLSADDDSDIAEQVMPIHRPPI